MAVKPVRRIQTQTAPGLHARMSREALSWTASRRELDGLERAHPELVVEQNGNLLAAVGGTRAALAYAYRNDRAFADSFPPMFDELLPRARNVLGAETVRFRLSHGPSRPAVEPVLKKLWFERGRPWLEFAMTRGRTLPSAMPNRRAPERRGVR